MEQEHRWAGVAGLAGLNLVVIVIAGAVGAYLLRWPFSFAAPLIAQLLCFLGLCHALAANSALFPNHPVYADGDVAAALGRIERTRGRLLLIDRVGGALAILLGLGALVVLGVAPGASRSLTLAVCITAFALGFAMLGHSTGLIALQPAALYARFRGAAAEARVLRAENLHYRQRDTSFSMARMYDLALQVVPPDGPAFETSVRQGFTRHPSRMPQAGATIAVRYIPGHPQCVVALLDPDAG